MHSSKTGYNNRTTIPVYFWLLIKEIVFYVFFSDQLEDFEEEVVSEEEDDWR